jgi:ferredoxin
LNKLYKPKLSLLFINKERKINMAKLSVDKEKCIGCGACVSLCPKSFEMVDGKAKPIKTDVKKITCEKEAADSCPVGAISIK